MGLTSIEWTASVKADGTIVPGYSWSPWWGCVEVSPACDNCYARELAHRYGHDVWGKDKPRRELSAAHWKQPYAWDRAAARDGVRRRVFPSMCDPFEYRTGEYSDQIKWLRDDFWCMIECTPRLDWLLLTKRPNNVGRLIPDRWNVGFPKNVWLGVSIEDQPTADTRIPELLRTPAAGRFVSYEPALGPVDLRPYLLEQIGCDAAARDGFHRPPLDWVITGGESGAKARPSHPQWFRDVREQCAAAGVPFFFKQWGEWAPMSDHGIGRYKEQTFVDRIDTNGLRFGTGVYRVGKRSAGAMLDGREHREFPRAVEPRP